jgi:hypothetical protein
MHPMQSTNASQGRGTWLAVVLALVAAVAYVLIAVKMLDVGDLELKQDGVVIMYVAAGGYLLGGLLILLRRRWVWILGALINLFVMLFFFNMYQARPAVITSAGGLTTKAAELLLEATLIYLIIRAWLSPRGRLVER